jgi:hypothetical protein
MRHPASLEEPSEQRGEEARVPEPVDIVQDEVGAVCVASSLCGSLPSW